MDDSLPLSSKIGQTALNLLGFAMTSYIVSSLSLFFAGNMPLLAGLVALAVAVTIAVAIRLIILELYSLLLSRRARFLVA